MTSTTSKTGLGQLEDQLEGVKLGVGESDDEVSEEEVATSASTKKKKKKKRKPKLKKPELNVVENGGAIPPETPSLLIDETEAQRAEWECQLSKGCKTYQVTPHNLLDDFNKVALDLLYTPSCKAVELRTSRLRLRTVEPGDAMMIRKIKTEPSVQKTQLYGNPSPLLIKPVFVSRYLATCMPRIPRVGTSLLAREEYVFAITAKDPTSIKIHAPGSIKLANRITSTEGYLGNIAIKLEIGNLPTKASPFSPIKGNPLTQPTFQELEKAKVVGKMYYEIHPQLWGQGIVSEAFAEVLRFGMEELGCTSMVADPTTINPASIKICLKNGMKFIKIVETAEKPQVWHEITRKEWWEKERRGKPFTDAWGGKEICRWCMNVRLAPPQIQCSGCSWARYCSRECQRADWVMGRGHQAECDFES